MLETQEERLPTRRRGEDGATGVVSSCPRRASKRNGRERHRIETDATGAKRKSPFSLENPTQSREIKATAGWHAD
jgi:hypothetical protein